MYIQEYLVRERHQARLIQAQEERSAQQIVKLRKLERRQERAERELLHMRQRVERLWSMLGAVS